MTAVGLEWEVAGHESERGGEMVTATNRHPAGNAARAARGGARPRLRLLGPRGKGEVPATAPLEERVAGALRALWSLARDPEGKAIVAKLAKEYGASRGRARVTDKLMSRLASAQSVVRVMQAVGRGPRDVELLERLEALHGEILTECAG